METIYDKYGGQSFWETVLDKFYEKNLADPVIRHHFAGKDIERVKAMNRCLLAAALRTTEDHFSISVKRVHRNFGIDGRGFESFAQSFKAALVEHKVEADDVEMILEVVTSFRDDVVERDTWQKKTHHLYDHDSSSISKSSFQISTSATIYLENNTCKLYTPRCSKFMLPSFEPLIGFKLSQGEFLAYQIGNSPNKRLWLAIRHTNPKGADLTEGDVLKLGRIRFKIRRLVLKTSSNKKESMLKCFDSLASQIEVNEELEADAACRICFCPETDEDPLISPCQCLGSIKYIHISCIKNWLKCKVQTKTTASTISYYWNDLICELCKTSLPSSIYYSGNKLDLISLEYPSKPYMIFEEFSPENLASTGLHIVCIDNNKTISIGRAQDADLKISDISVSRNHAYLRFSDNKFAIIDNKSKFGTLLKMKKVVAIGNKANVAIQVSRTIFHIALKKKINWKKCCCKSLKKVAPEWSYITQEGFDQSVLEQHSGVDLHNVSQSARSNSYNED